MDHSNYSGYRDYRPQSDIGYGSGEDRDYVRLSPRDRNRKDEYRPETEYHAHTFQKNKGGDRHNRDNLRNLPPKYF